MCRFLFTLSNEEFAICIDLISFAMYEDLLHRLLSILSHRASCILQVFGVKLYDLGLELCHVCRSSILNVHKLLLNFALFDPRQIIECLRVL